MAETGTSISLKTAAAYLRVSTTEQTEFSPDAQLRAIRDYASKSGIVLLEEHIYQDDASGTDIKKRIQFQKMISVAKSKPKPFDAIIVHKFDRFARSREDSIIYKKLLRQDLKIDVLSVTEPTDDSNISQLVEGIMETMAEFYSKNLSGEVIKGMSEKARRGEMHVTPPYGYDKEPGKPYTINEQETKYVQLIYEWFLNGDSYFAIAGRLNELGIRTKRGNLFENRTIEYILHNIVYAGYTRWSPDKIISKRIFDHPDTIIAKSTHEPIIPEDVFNMVQEKIKTAKLTRQTKERPVESKKHYLSGILRCGNCGGS
ncbi:MAG: recombinase family protein, partial [Clostridia bacterium]|nr:recombinase family protein [Clostridia bacterium]